MEVQGSSVKSPGDAQLSNQKYYSTNVIYSTSTEGFNEAFSFKHNNQCFDVGRNY